MEEAVGTGMGIAVAVLIWIAIGIVIGFLARLVLPGRQAIGVFGTVLAGIGGAVIAGFVGDAISDQVWVHIVTAVVGAMVLIGILSLFSRS